MKLSAMSESGHPLQQSLSNERVTSLLFRQDSVYLKYLSSTNQNTASAIYPTLS